MQKKVFTAMAIVGLLLMGYTLKLHEHILPASEEQAHHAPPARTGGPASLRRTGRSGQLDRGGPGRFCWAMGMG